MKKINYNDKIAVVTGASSGIGKEIAKRLILDHDCTVYAIARGVERLKEAQGELGEKADRYIIYPFDVSKREEWEKFYAHLTENNVKIELLFNCAGILPKFQSLESTSIEEYERVMGINYMSQVYACKILLPIIEGETPCIVNVASASALCPFSGVSAYTSSKAALQRFTESIAGEGRDVFVCCVLPGFVKTDIMKNQEMNEKEAGLINAFSADLNKTVTKILKRVKNRKKRIILGFDGHFMSGFYRLFPNLAPRLISWFLKKSGISMFNSEGGAKK